MKYLMLALFGAGWLYECYAILTGRVPTITQRVHRCREQPAVAVGAGALTSWIYYHLMIESR